MGLPKGRTNNPDGRPPGSKNKSTEEIKRLLVEFVSGNMDDLQSTFNRLEPKEKLMFFEKILRYILPEKTSNTTEVDVSKLSESEVDELLDKILKHENDE